MTKEEKVGIIVKREKREEKKSEKDEKSFKKSLTKWKRHDIIVLAL